MHAPIHADVGHGPKENWKHVSNNWKHPLPVAYKNIVSTVEPFYSNTLWAFPYPPLQQHSINYFSDIPDKGHL